MPSEVVDGEIMHYSVSLRNLTVVARSTASGPLRGPHAKFRGLVRLKVTHTYV